MTVYSKICIICSKNFYTVRVSTMYCSKKCRNRVRYLPQQIVNSLIQRNAQFTMKANRFTASMDDGRIIDSQPLDLELGAALARDEARKRGIKIPKGIDNNIDFINIKDPANGGSDGFNNTSMAVSSGSGDSNSGINKSPDVRQEGHTDGLLPRRGLRRLGQR